MTNQYGRGLPPRFRRGFGDVGVPPAQVGSPLQTPSAVVLPGSVPNTLPQPQSDDFFDPSRDGTDVMFYSTAAIASIASGASNSPSIQIDSGVDFYWVASTYMLDVTGTVPQEATVSIPLVSILINDTGSRKNLMNTPFPLGSLAGFGERPYRLIRPRLFKASSTINFTFFNYSSGTTYNNLYFVLHGYTKPRNT